MKCMFGYLNTNEWIAGLNIGTLMHISMLNLHDLLSCPHKDTELSREAILEKAVLISTAYFCVATEKRILYQQSQVQATDRIAQYQYIASSKER